MQEELLAGRLPVEERVSRYTIQSWLSTRLKQQKQNDDPKVRSQIIQQPHSHIIFCLLLFVYDCIHTLTYFESQVVRKRAVTAAKKRILEEAWGFDTSALTKVQLIARLIACGCSLKVRGNPGDFKSADSKQTLLDLLHSKMPIPSSHVSLDDFLTDVEAKAQVEGDAAVLAMAVTNVLTVPRSTQSATTCSPQTPQDVPSDPKRTQAAAAGRVPPPTPHSVSSFPRRTQAAAVDVPPPTSPSSSDKDSDTSNSSEESTEDEEGIVCVGDKFVYSDEDEGDSTLTVQRIVHGGIVFVEEDEDTLCLEYVRKKVIVRRSVGGRQSRGTRKSSRA